MWLKGTVLGIYEAVGNAEMNFEKDYYGILGVLPNAPVDVIKAVYRALAKRYHPDTYDGLKEEAEELFKSLNEAFEVLSDASRRSQYDRMRREPRAGHTAQTAAQGDRQSAHSNSKANSRESDVRSADDDVLRTQGNFFRVLWGVGLAGFGLLFFLVWQASIVGVASRQKELGNPRLTLVEDVDNLKSARTFSPVQEYDLVPINPASPRAMVGWLQGRLNQLGWNAGERDGVAGPTTRAAIVGFQKFQGMEPTGVVSEELFTIVESSFPPSKRCVLQAGGTVVCPNGF